MDPLKPFSTSIRKLWERSTASRTSRTAETSTRKPSEAEVGSAGTSDATIEGALRAKLRQLPDWNGDRARAFFVETIVLKEFGESVATDPTFSELVEHVSQQIALAPDLNARLDDLLRSLHRE